MRLFSLAMELVWKAEERGAVVAGDDGWRYEVDAMTEGHCQRIDPKPSINAVCARAHSPLHELVDALAWKLKVAPAGPCRLREARRRCNAMAMLTMAMRRDAMRCDAMRCDASVRLGAGIGRS